MLLNNKYEYNPRTDQLGKGGFGTVFKATDTILNRAVALKLVDRNNLPAKYSLVSEISRVIDLNLVRYYDAFIYTATDSMGQETEVQVGVMEYVNGGDLKQFCGRANTIPDLNELLQGILDGLTYLHSKGIIHRDIKPQNILLQKEHGKLIPKISDFGISKNIGDSGSTVSGLVGSQAYMSPEQLNNTGGKLSPASDVWAFGILVYELFTGERPFDTPGVTSDAQIITNIVTCRLPERINTLPQPYQDVVKACVTKDIHRRIGSAVDVKAMLALKGDETIVQPTPLVQTQMVYDEEKTVIQSPKLQASGETGKTDKTSPRKKKSKVWVIPVLIVALCFAGYVYSIGGQKDKLYSEYMQTAEKALENKEYTSSEEAYNKALEIKPGDIDAEVGLMGVLNRRRLMEEDEQAWQNAREKNTIASYGNYIESYPSGTYAEEANAAIDKLEAQAERDRLAKEAAAQAERNRLAKEAAAQAERDRIASEKKAEEEKYKEFFEDFIDNDNNWTTSHTEYRESSISDGKYCCEYFLENGVYMVTKAIPIDEKKNFEIKAKIEKISGIQNNGYGIIFGRKDSDNQFYFQISGNGSYKIDMYDNGDKINNKYWTESSYINQGNGAVNILSVKKIGQKFRFYINSNFVYESNYEKFFGDRIGFVIFQNQKIAIDYLSVRYL